MRREEVGFVGSSSSSLFNCGDGGADYRMENDAMLAYKFAV